MATKVSEVVRVKALSKYGFQSEDGSYVNWGKFVKDADKARVVPGAAFEMEIYIGDKGGKSVNSIGKQVGEDTAPPTLTGAVLRSTQKPEEWAPPHGSVTQNQTRPRVPSVLVDADPVFQPNAKVSVARDFQKEARGKTFCQYMSSVLSNSAVDIENVEKFIPLIERLVKATFEVK